MMFNNEDNYSHVPMLIKTFCIVANKRHVAEITSGAFNSTNNKWNHMCNM